MHDLRATFTTVSVLSGGAALAPSVLACFHATRAELGREPTLEDLAARTQLKVGTLRPIVASLVELGLTKPLTAQQKACLSAVKALGIRLGRSPSTREVSDEMGLAPSSSRFHITSLVKLGLLTPPEVRLVLSVTPEGAACVP